MPKNFRAGLTVLAGLAASFWALTPAHAAAPAAAEQEVARLETLYTQSFVTGDTSVVERLMQDDFIGYNSDAKPTGKAAILAEIKGASRPAAIAITSLKIRLHGDTAIALGTEEDTIAGKTAKEHVQWLDTWMKMPGGWRLVSSAEVTLKE